MANARERAKVASDTALRRFGEVARLAGKFLYVMILGVFVGIAGLEQTVVDPHESPYFWIALMLLFLVIAFAVVAFRAISERDRALHGAPPVLGRVLHEHAWAEKGTEAFPPGVVEQPPGAEFATTPPAPVQVRKPRLSQDAQ